MECSFEGCNRPIKCKKLCPTHYYQSWGGKELTPIRTWRSDPNIECLITDCKNSAAVKGLCKSHANKAYRFNVSSKGLNYLLAITSCECCGWKGKLHIDHDHGCCDYNGSCGNCIRGMLCAACNKVVGSVELGKCLLVQPQEYLKNRKSLALGSWKS